ncbi:MAG: 50S ribosomal protein L29 [Parcubacteria group bacterium ADurb.Bin247]|jgi:ribosomal protein L29|nr:MAG: 50S ribosomal protein L29 [Parcubacteria group bacterium ADurb.Bin247]HQB85234.1 50S ribosomal protein L29 [Candidatus Pacearchaeota archaeon]
MKTVELRKKTKEELENMLLKQRNDLRVIRFSGLAHNKNVKETNAIKKDIARILTVLKEK